MHNLLKSICIAVIFIGVVSCSDNSTGSDPGNPPELPEIQQEAAEPDVSFFEDNMPQKLLKGETTNFYEARSVALVNGISLVSLGLYNGFIESAQSADAEYNNGVWEWTYSYSYEGMNIEIRLTAETSGDNTKWAEYWTYDNGQELAFDDYKVFEGTISEDGSEGNWTFNTLYPNSEEEVPALEWNWTVESETKKSILIKYYEEDGTTLGTIDYNEDFPEHTMIINDLGSDGEVTVYWNSETKTGYIQQGSEKKCWDENFQNTPCS